MSMFAGAPVAPRCERTRFHDCGSTNARFIEGDPAMRRRANVDTQISVIAARTL
ncbi:hypothetical protein SBC1_16360 [Caballeronia sp. SBC1]|nr:hypothetical protein SBC2_17710 [Caballeronia sp. SBC2]QIN61642.1 hypothetical protein SBC1_16360 [Caballeronia sp. SBC1]